MTEPYDTALDDHKVGYASPPRHSQFKAGQSGNPKGRPKGKRNVSSELRDIMSLRVTINENGKRKRMSTMGAALLRLREKALSGNLQALQLLLTLCRDHLTDNDGAPDLRTLLEEDIDILSGAGLLRGGTRDDKRP